MTVFIATVLSIIGPNENPKLIVEISIPGDLDMTLPLHRWKKNIASQSNTNWLGNGEGASLNDITIWFPAHWLSCRRIPLELG